MEIPTTSRTKYVILTMTIDYKKKKKVVGVSLPFRHYPLWEVGADTAMMEEGLR